MHFFFAYYPYICITLLLAGLAFRYVTDPGDWNARSSEIFAPGINHFPLCDHLIFLWAYCGPAHAR